MEDTTTMRVTWVEKIVSGGQTGADRAGLDWAIDQGVPHGGWCPRGRRAEDGPLPERYLLQETPLKNLRQRTEWNARDSEGTVVFTFEQVATGGSGKTILMAARYGRPCLHLHAGVRDPKRELLEFVKRHGIRLLNVAGSRESKEPGIYAWVLQILESVNR